MNSIIETIKNLNAETTINIIIAIVILAILDIFSPLFSYIILKIFNFDGTLQNILYIPKHHLIL